MLATWMASCTTSARVLPFLLSNIALSITSAVSMYLVASRTSRRPLSWPLSCALSFPLSKSWALSASCPACPACPVCPACPACMPCSSESKAAMCARASAKGSPSREPRRCTRTVGGVSAARLYLLMKDVDGLIFLADIKYWTNIVRYGNLRNRKLTGLIHRTLGYLLAFEQIVIGRKAKLSVGSWLQLNRAQNLLRWRLLKDKYKTNWMVLIDHLMTMLYYLIAVKHFNYGSTNLWNGYTTDIPY